MKSVVKNKKSLGSKKHKRQPDPILRQTKKSSEKLGSSQRKRLQKRIESQFSKKKKSNIKKKSEESENESEDEKEEIVSDLEDEKMDDDCEDQVEVANLNDLNLDNEDEDDNDNNDFDNLVVSDDDDISMNDDDIVDNDDAESIIEDSYDEDDMVTNINDGDVVIKVSDQDSLNSRIKANMDILENFKDFKSKNKCQPRLFYVTQFLDDLCMKFSYNKFLIKKFYDIFNTDLFKFLVAAEEERPVTIRTNTLKTRRRQLKETLVNRDCEVEALHFSKVGMVVFSTKYAIGASPEYLAGHFLLQGSSSMLPVMALAPKPGERILDMCAAPGGKTTHIAQMMGNTGIIFANDINKDRLKAVTCNLARMGVMNTIVTVYDGRLIHKRVKDFDRVLCDAPCTGTGVISKDKSIKASKDESDLKRMTGIQKQLICSAIDACRVGGYVVYSTCSILVEENEQVVDYACRKRNVKLVETGLFGKPGFINFCSKHFNKNMDRTRRYYPHENNMDGFFLAKLQKTAERTVEPTASSN